jgi:hypothetical protein
MILPDTIAFVQATRLLFTGFPTEPLLGNLHLLRMHERSFGGMILAVRARAEEANKVLIG